MCCVCSRVCRAAMSAAEADLAEVQDELADLYMLFSTGGCAQVEWCFRHAERVLHVLIWPMAHLHLQKLRTATKLRRHGFPNSLNRLVCMHKRHTCADGNARLHKHTSPSAAVCRDLRNQQKAGAIKHTPTMLLLDSPLTYGAV